VTLKAEQSPRQWFEDAERWYRDEHQGCPCCRARHCVFRSEWGGRVEYYCTSCDFSACHDRPTGRWFAVAGADRGQPVAILGILGVPLGHNGD
jgi:hypothetical protein